MLGKNFSCNNASGNRKQNDYYATHYSLTKQLLEIEKFEGSILEPCCGKEKAIVKVLNNFDVSYYDIEDGIDFFNEINLYDNIITNPPYKDSMKWIAKCKQIAKYKFALLLPLAHLQGINRLYNNIYKDKEYGLSKVYIFCRYPMLGAELRDDGKYPTGMMTLAWMIWEKGFCDKPTIDWIDNNKYVLKKGD